MSSSNLQRVALNVNIHCIDLYLLKFVGTGMAIPF